jgi:hypothetical protein
MKKTAFLTILFAVTAAGISAQIPPDWDTNPPRDTAQFKYMVGVSQPSTSEQEAWVSARRDAVQQFASSIVTRFQGQSDVTIQSGYFSSGIEDTYTVHLETASFSTNVPVTGITEQARKIETVNGRYVARMLAAMSVADYNKARQYVDNEEAAYLAYRHFGQRGLFAIRGNEKPSGFQDYYSWLRINCVIVSIDDPNPNPLLEQIDLFIKKLYKNAALFAQIIDGRGARIVYNSGRYYDGILRALLDTKLFTIQRESMQLVLKPVRGNILGDLRAAVSSMKDSGKFVITGLETIQTQGGDTVNSGTIIINQFKTISSRQHNMQAVNFSIPGQYLSGFVDEDGIIRHIQNNSAAFPARYLVICYSETRLEKGMAEFKIPPLVSASCRFTLYDIVTGETMHSEPVQTSLAAFSPSDLGDRAVISESQRALRFLFDAKNRPGLEDIIKGVFEQL